MLNEHDVHDRPVHVLRGAAPQTVVSGPCVMSLVLGEITRVFNDRNLGRSLYGVRKIWDRLDREHKLGGHVEIGHVAKMSG